MMFFYSIESSSNILLHLALGFGFELKKQVPELSQCTSPVIILTTGVVDMNGRAPSTEK